MRVIIIGAAGYIGRNLSYYLKSQNHCVEKYDIKVSKTEDIKFLDLSDSQSLESLNIDVDVIYLLSGRTGSYIGFEEYKSFLNVNELGLLNLLNYIRKSSFRPRIIYPSTRLVYKGDKRPLKECDPKEARSIYAANKIAAEHFLQSYAFAFDIPYTIFRLCVPYGSIVDGEYSYGTIGFFIKQASQGKNISLYGGGNQKRTFTHIEDLCYILEKIALIKETENQTYNIGGNDLSLFEAATIVAKRFGIIVESTPWPEKDLRIESGDTMFCADKLYTALGDIKYKNFIEWASCLKKSEN